MEPKLYGSEIILEYLSLNDIDHYLAQFSKTIQTCLQVHDFESERDYLIARCTQDAFFYIIQKKDGTLIGALEIRDPGHISQLYCWINEQFWGRGYFKEALRLAVREYANQTNEATISACVDAHNERSFNALQKCGFAKKGTRMGPHGKQYILYLQINDIL